MIAELMTQRALPQNQDHSHAYIMDAIGNNRISLHQLNRQDRRGTNRGSYMSAHILLNLFNELMKRDNIRGLLNILYLFCKKFNKINNTGARTLDYIYHMTLKLL